MIVRLTQYISAYRFSDCPNLTVYVTKLLTLYWQGHILSGQGCFRVLLCCFSLRVRPVHVLQAPCRAPKRPLSDSLTSSRFDSGIFKEAEWGVLNARPLTTTQKMPESGRWRRVSPCQFRLACPERYLTLPRHGTELRPVESHPWNIAAEQKRLSPHFYCNFACWSNKLKRFFRKIYHTVCTHFLPAACSPAYCLTGRNWRPCSFVLA